ncbi:MAG: NYN domain-containing protein [Thermodesulfovibrionia bacterium]
MAHLLIDGYNLIGVLHKDLEVARNDILRKLSEYSKTKGHHITIVFDGWKDGKPEEMITWIGGIRVIYSRLGEKADAVIMRIISEERKPWIVVSSDKEIANFTIRHNLIPIRADEFEERLYRALLQEPASNAEYYDEWEGDAHQRKGTSKRLSKFKRRKLQALSKL